VTPTEPGPEPDDDDTGEWPAPQPDPEEEPNETTEGLLPTLERIQTMDREDLIDLRDRVVYWTGPFVLRFRQRVAERLAS
jgi:hypothetical protein